MKSAREQLADLEKENNYLFHGGGLEVEEFEPRQAHTVIDGKKVPDGDPATFASPFAEYAIFMALINKDNFKKGYHSGCRYRNGSLEFRATKETLDQLNSGITGFVHVFKRSDFTERNPSEWISYKNVVPISIIKISRTDFTSPIEEMPEIFE